MSLVTYSRKNRNILIFPIFILLFGYLAGMLLVDIDSLDLIYCSLLTLIVLLISLHNEKYALIFGLILAYFGPFAARVIYHVNVLLDLSPKTDLVPFSLTTTISTIVLSILYVKLFVGYLIKRGLILYKMDILIYCYLIYGFFQIINPNLPLIQNLVGFVTGNFILAFSYFLPRKLIRTKTDIVRMYEILIVLGLILVSYGLFQFIFGLPKFEQAFFAQKKPILDGFYYMENMRIRVMSFCSGHNTFFQSIAILGVFVITNNSIINHKSRRGFRLLKNIFLFFLILIFSLTLERTSVMLFLIGVIGAKIVNAKRNISLRNACLGLMFFMSSFLIVDYFSTYLLASSEYRIHRAGEMRNPIQARSFQGRMQIWPGAISLVSQHPMGLGLGVNREGRLATHVVGENFLTSFYAHNEYLRKLIEGGFLYLLLFLSILVSWFVLSFQTIRKGESKIITKFAQAYIGILLGCMAAGIVNEPFTYNIMVWFLGGIIPLLSKFDKEERKCKSL